MGKRPRVTAEALESYIDSHANFKTSDKGGHFGMSGAGAFYWLKKLGFFISNFFVSLFS